MGMKRIPVILDTDIGGDIDDTWALALALNSPELDVRLILTESGDTLYRAMVTAKFLEAAGRTNIPIGVGIATTHESYQFIKTQEAWLEGYDFIAYPGTVHKDGVGALIDTVMNAGEEITILAIGPLTNIAAALERRPEIARKSRFVGMQGNIREHFANHTQVVPEFNMKLYPEASQKVFTAPWDMTITPLDTCGLVTLEGERYERIYRSEKPIAKALMENYRLWVKALPKYHPTKYERESTILYDTVAVYLAFADELLEMEALGIRVLQDGFTQVDETTKRINCAMKWKNIDAFKDFLVERLTI